MFWQMPVPWVDEAIRHYSEESFRNWASGAYIAAGYCANILVNLAEGKEVKYFPKFYLAIVGRDMILIISSDSSWHETAPRQCSSRDLGEKVALASLYRIHRLA